MSAVVLLSAGRHASGRPAPVPAETAATALADGAGLQPVGLHAGPAAAAVADHLGLGLARVVHLAVAAATDPLDPLVAWLEGERPEVILAGRRGMGGEDSGMLPYRLAQRLELPIVADVVAIERSEGGLLLTQSLPKGRRREAEMAGAFVATVAAEAPLRVFAPGAARRGAIETRAPAVTGRAWPTPEERPWRARPRLISGGAEAPEGGGRLLVDPSPDDAAAAILAELDMLGLLPARD